MGASACAQTMTESSDGMALVSLSQIGLSIPCCCWIVSKMP